MFYTYTFSEDFFSELFDKNLELVGEKVYNILEKISKNSCFIDCPDDGMETKLKNDFLLVYDSLLEGDVILKKKLEILFGYVISKNRVRLSKKKCCTCQNTNNCNLYKNISSIQKCIPNFPSFIITPKENKKYNNINLFKYRESDFFSKNFNKTSYSEEAEFSFEKGKELIKKNWGNLIALCKEEIVIVDPLFFSKWDENFLFGLRQFSEIIKEINPSIIFKIVTKKNNHKSQQQRSGNFKTQSTVIKEIKNAILEIENLKIEVILSSRNAKFDHDRFIKFDDIIGAEIHKGVDTFYLKNNKIDRYSIIYYSIKEIEKFFEDPLRNKETTIKNY